MKEKRLRIDLNNIVRTEILRFARKNYLSFEIAVERTDLRLSGRLLEPSRAETVIFKEGNLEKID